MCLELKSVENLINCIMHKMQLRSTPRLDPRVRLARWVWRNPGKRRVT